jgi:hypothetical protein
VIGRESKQWTAPRILALALALWGTLSPTVAVLHLAAAPHAICPEHGELIELGSRSAGAAPAEDDSPRPDEHLHCAASTPLRSPACIEPRRAIAVERTDTGSRVGGFATRVLPAPPCVVTCAPKQSPPAAA